MYWPNQLGSWLGQYIDFCTAMGKPIATVATSWLTLYPTNMPSTMTVTETVSTVGGGETYEVTTETIQSLIITFSTRPEYFFHLSVGSIVSSYIPSSIFSQLAYSVSLSAGAASVTGDATSLIYAALEATSVPSWFSAAVPATYSSQMHTLQEQINQLRATPVSLAPVPTSSPTSSNSLPPTSSTPSTCE